MEGGKMRRVRRYITREQFDEMLKAENKSSWVQDNLLSVVDVCGYGYYGFDCYGIDNNGCYVEYSLGSSCD